MTVAVLELPALRYETHLRDYALSDAESPLSWIQVARTGKFVSSRYGEFEITPADLRQMYSNFKSVTPKPPTRLAVDYDHLSMNPERPEDGKAAGWFVDLQLRNNNHELWAQVEWTPKAAESIKTKEYQFVSPTFVKNYRYKDGTTIGTTLISAAITNHPFLEGMAALTLSMSGENIAIAQPEAQMQKIKAKDVNGNDVEIALDSLSADALAQHPHVLSLSKQKTDPPAEIKTLSDTVNTLQSTVTSLSEKLTASETARQAAELRLSDERAESRVKELTRAGRIKTDEATQKFALKMAKLSDADFNEWVSTLPEAVVKLNTEHGSGHAPVESDAEKRFIAEVEKYERDHKVGRGAAISAVALADPALARAYRLSLNGMA